MGKFSFIYITLYKTCRKNKIGALKVQITNVLMKIMRNGGRDASIGVRGAKKGENGGGMNIKFFFFTLFQNFMVPLDSS